MLRVPCAYISSPVPSVRTRTTPPPRWVMAVPSLPTARRIAVVADGDVQPAVDAQRDAVGRVVGAAEVEIEAQSLHQLFRHVGDAVAGRVAIGGEVGRMHHVQRASVERDAARTVHLGEHGVAVGRAVTVAVDQSHDTAFPLRGGEREVGIDAGEHDAIDGGGEAHRVHRDGRCSEQRGGEARRRRDLLQQGGLAGGVAWHRAASGGRLGKRHRRGHRCRSGDGEETSNREAVHHQIGSGRKVSKSALHNHGLDRLL